MASFLRGLFTPKPKVTSKSEADVATLFYEVAWTLGRREYGPALIQAISDLNMFEDLGPFDGIIPHYTIANLSVEMQALENLFPTDQAARLRAHIRQELAARGGDEPGEWLSSELDAYDSAWKEGLEYLPHYTPGSHLPTPVELVAERVTTQWLGREEPSYILAVPIAQFLGIAGIWKDFKEKYEITS